MNMRNFLKFILPLILATQMTVRAGRIEIRSTEQGAGWIHLRDDAMIPAKSDPVATGLTSRALASADFDEDGTPDLPTLRGKEAVDHLQKTGQYGSLMDAVKAAVRKDGRTEVESPKTDAFGLRAKLKASDDQYFHYFGDSVAISGSTAVVGAPLHDSRVGAAYVFVRSGFTWVEEQKLTASDGATHADFGLRVAIDGERVIVGAPGANIGTAHDQGAAYIFVRSGTVWNQEIKLTGADSNAGDEFGRSVAISGVTAVVGSFRGAGIYSGSAYVFVKGTIWTQQQKLVAADGAEGDDFSETGLAISGETIIVGARWCNIGGNQLQGAAYFFTRSGSTWTQQQKVTAPDGVPFAEFGRSVAISGETAIVGAWKDNDGVSLIPGSAWVFVRNGTFWTPQQKLAAPDVADRGHFGVAVAIDGETAIVGANFDGPLLNQGSAYIFVRDGTTWTQQQKLAALDAAEHDRFGLGVAMSGETVIIGAVFNGGGGSAYVYGTRSSSVVAPPEKIAFSSNRDGNDEIYVMNPDGSGQTRLTNDAGSDLHPSFTADESLITFSSTRDGNAEIYVMNGDDGSNPTRLTNNSASDTQPSFSPDGLHIVFTSNRDGNDEIYIMDADGNHQTRLTNNNLSDTDPSFSPDGTRVLFENVGADNNRDIYIMNSNGTNPTRLTTAAGDDRSASFSKDGTRIAFASAQDGNNEIYVMDADGNNQTRLTNNSFSDTEPSFSPDGTHIAFESDRDGNFEIYSMNANGTNQSRLINNSAIDAAPDWGGYISPLIAGRKTASDGTQNAFFGTSVAISGDTAIVGANGAIVGANSQGAAYVFVRIGGAWIEQQKLVAADGASLDYFGISVAISGETAIVGARFDDIGTGTDQGSAYVFVRSGTTWTQQQKLTAANAVNNDRFGWSVAINGETAVVGAVGANNGRGSAYVFVRNGTAWIQQQQLTAADGALNDFLGISVGISGETVIVGAPSASVGANAQQGTAYVFVRNGATWIQQQKLTAADGAPQDNFGQSVGISGETVVVSAPRDNVGSNALQGSAYTFVRNGTTWTQQQKLTAADGAANDIFGQSVAISGETVTVGANFADVSAGNQGAAYTFTRSGTVWTQLQKVIAPDAAANDSFGWSVSISGERAIVGALGKTIGTNVNQGAAYIFATILPPPPTPTPSPTPTVTPVPNTTPGSNIKLETLDASVTFSTVTQAGNTRFSEIDPLSAGTPPAGYVICRTCPAYDITTTAVYTPPVNVCLGVPRAISQQAFLALILLHGEAGVLVDRTTGRFTDDGGNRTVCGSVSSLSPFVLAAPSGTPTPTASPTPGGTPTPTATPSQLLNISTRLQVQTGDNVLIGGFIITGTQAKKVIVRAIGPSLSSFFPGALTDPIMELRNSAGGLIASNDNWRSDQEAEIIATTIPPSNDLESAIVATLPANNSAYTAIVRGTNNGTGIGVVEGYDLDQTASSKLANISTRGFVDTGDNVMIGGFIIGGNGGAAGRVVVRAIGPSLGGVGINNALQDPFLELHDANGSTLMTNDNWRSTQQAEIEATGLAPTNDLESALVTTLQDGNYTAIVRGNGGTTGVAVVEVYNIL